MKKFLAIVLAAATIGMGAAGMAGCKDNLKPIVEREDKNIVVGVTNYKPMDYLEKGEWVGFDADLARKVFSDLGYTVEFYEMDWDTKIVTLNAGTLDGEVLGEVLVGIEFNSRAVLLQNMVHSGASLCSPISLCPRFRFVREAPRGIPIRSNSPRFVEMPTGHFQSLRNSLG